MPPYKKSLVPKKKRGKGKEKQQEAIPIKKDQ